MFPIRDDIPTRNAAIVVGSLIVANTLAFGYEIALGGRTGTDAAVSEFIATWGLIPREFLRELAQPGSTSQIVWLTPITSMFLHGGLLHLAGNLLYLWVFGGPIEDLLGHGRFLLFYAVCGLTASAVHVASDPSAYLATVGASGAISGVLGAYLVSYPRSRLRLLWPAVSVPAVLFLGVWIVIQVISGVNSGAAEEGGVAWWSHVGGFAAGIVLARSMRIRLPTRSRLRS